MKLLKKILVVDDDDTCLFITQRMFKKLEIEADILAARNGQEALNLLKDTCQIAECPELILLDIKMPVMDGFEFLEELQKTVELNSIPLKIVLVSSSAHELDLAKAKKYPVIDYIVKPLTPEKLARIL